MGAARSLNVRESSGPVSAKEIYQTQITFGQNVPILQGLVRLQGSPQLSFVSLEIGIFTEFDPDLGASVQREGVESSYPFNQGFNLVGQPRARPPCVPDISAPEEETLIARSARGTKPLIHRIVRLGVRLRRRRSGERKDCSTGTANGAVVPQALDRKAGGQCLMLPVAPERPHHSLLSARGISAKSQEDARD